ncbi:phosphoribosylanthranilate isomerase [Seinonella peptonophila]|uniref:N-(5'-phosphoribosyl)anthranilate isomerase n=1 Tax=Seinonella peptonophila TaxID=112248 RepID=A0A1M4TER1_9BACL|nr:phosphoribosylanthranilate isomerase [Seinonella peptonophila]SHE43039.1 phosphoribosylanthranilate isomerase [Seinonella peptonophila]
MSIKLKCCGFQNPEDVRQAIVYPLDAIGFILVQNRKRSVSKESFYSLISIVPSSIERVGVLINPTIEEVQSWLAVASFDRIQLHGTESPAQCKEIAAHFPNMKITKVFHVGENEPKQVIDYVAYIDMLLLDSTVRGQRGGTGQNFDWSKIPAFKKICDQYQLPLWIAGGIQVNNVSLLLDQYSIAGVDVSSGIEREHRKDADLIREMIWRVKRYESS